jgi:hypothetical protein
MSMAKNGFFMAVPDLAARRQRAPFGSETTTGISDGQSTVTPALFGLQGEASSQYCPKKRRKKSGS